MMPTLSFSILMLLPLIPPAPRFQLHTFDGRTQTGVPTSLSADGQLQFQTDELTTRSWADVQWLRRSDRTLPGLPHSPYLLLANGDRLPVRLLSADGERLRIQLGELWNGQTTDLPIKAIRGFWNAAPATLENLAQKHWAFEHDSPVRDRFLLRNDDILEGSWLKMQEDRLEISSAGKTTSIALPRLAAFTLQQTAAQHAARPKISARLVLVDGSRITVDQIQLSRDGRLQIHSDYGVTASFPLATVAALEPMTDRLVYLSDLTPTIEMTRPFLDTDWPLVRDGNAARSWLRLDGQLFDKGLGIHGASEVDYLLDGKYRTLEALVGLDDRAGRQGRARVRVMVDGREKFTSSELRGGEKPLPVRVDVSGGMRLSLRVEEERGGGVQCHVDWGDARLLRQ